MENAVTAIAIDDSTLVTTSTGVKDVTDNVTGYCTRMWKNGQLVKSTRDHYSSIRCCSPFYLNEKPSTSFGGRADGFVTGGNDGKMMIYNTLGEKLSSCETPPNVFYHLPSVFIMCREKASILSL